LCVPANLFCYDLQLKGTLFSFCSLRAIFPSNLTALDFIAPVLFADKWCLESLFLRNFCNFQLLPHSYFRTLSSALFSSTRRFFLVRKEKFYNRSGLKSHDNIYIVTGCLIFSFLDRTFLSGLKQTVWYTIESDSEMVQYP
jgi:hypothetical protein